MATWNRRMIVLAAALAVAGCKTPASVKLPDGSSAAPVPYTQQVQHMQTMETSLSLVNNQDLQSVSTALQSLFSAFLGFGGPSAALTPAGAMQVMSLLGSTYHVEGLAKMGPIAISYDDTTGEVTGLSTPQAHVAIAYQASGDTHTLTLTLDKSPDGTTGSLMVGLTGTGWASVMLSKPVPVVDPTITTGPRMTASDVVMTAETMPMGMPSAVPYQIGNDELPKVVEGVTIALDVLPKGQKALECKLQFTGDKPAVINPNPALSFTMPTHWTVSATLPKLSFDLDATVAMPAPDVKQWSFTASGDLDLTAASGTEKFTYNVDLDGASEMENVTLTDETAQVKLTVNGAIGAPQPKINLVSLADGSTIGTIAPDPTTPGTLVITLKDGTRQSWKVLPANMIPSLPVAMPTSVGH